MSLEDTKVCVGNEKVGESFLADAPRANFCCGELHAACVLPVYEPEDRALIDPQYVRHLFQREKFVLHSRFSIRLNIGVSKVSIVQLV